MDATTPSPAPRHDGWTDARKVRFLGELAACGNVRSSCSHIGLSPEAAYRLRRRDALFARAWAAALVLAREASAEVLECRAIDGIEEAVWYRGEVVGHRRRYDARLLLAHMARLDAQAGSGTASEDAARFDELLACVGGTTPPAGLGIDDDGLPLPREACIDIAGEDAVPDTRRDDEADADGEDPGEAETAWDADEEIARFRETRAEAADRWDAWTRTAYAAVDRLLDDPAGDPFASPGTPSTSSTSSPSGKRSGRAGR